MSSTSYIALVDCNNFFVSCERLFRPDLSRVPVVVLSSNDGCVISRSNEAKALGIGMGEPYHKVREACRQKNVVAFSSNFSLYQDISNRVFCVIGRFSDRVERYSVDEAFLEVSIAEHSLVHAWACALREAVLHEVGVPVSVGVSHTKTLAKIATHVVKTRERKRISACMAGTLSAGVPESTDGTHLLLLPEDIVLACKETPVEDVWGVGRRLAPALHGVGIHTAFDVRHASPMWVRKRMSVQGLRTVHELQGLQCFPLVSTSMLRKSLMHSRSFGSATHELSVVRDAISHHARKVAEQLRRERAVVGTLVVMLYGGKFDERKVYTAEETFEVCTNDTLRLVALACTCVARLYKERVSYVKAGVLVKDISYEASVPSATLFGVETDATKPLMRTLDELRGSLGDLVHMGTEHPKPVHRTRATRLSPRYTTQWGEVRRVGL
jgi:DNA polymerase V